MVPQGNSRTPAFRKRFTFYTPSKDGKFLQTKDFCESFGYEGDKDYGSISRRISTFPGMPNFAGSKSGVKAERMFFASVDFMVTCTQ